jgi:hypothetical protein
MILSFPVVWALVLPEALVRGGSLGFWMSVSTAIAIAFCIHWQALLIAREMVD